MTAPMPDRASERPRLHVAAWLALVISGLARAALFTVAVMVVWAAVPAAWGWIPTTVASDSMAPQIRAGDAVVAAPVSGDAVNLGQVLLVDDPNHPDRLRLHRFVAVTELGDLVLRGDANLYSDSDPISPEAVHGVGVLRVPWVGLPGMWIAQRDYAALAIAAAGLLVLIWLARLRSPRRHRSAAAEPAPARRSSSRRRVLALAGVSALIAAAGVVVPAAPAYSSFTHAIGSPTSGFAALSAYPRLAPTALDSPYLLYRFNEVSGTSAIDGSGNGRTGTLRGTSTWVAGSCALNSSPALTLNGTSGYVSTPTAVAGPNVFTIEIWFRTTTTSGGRLIGFGNLQTGASTSFDRHIYMTNAGRLIFGVRPGTPRRTVTSTASYNDGAWHLVTATLSSAGMRLYVDGVLVASSSAATTAQSGTGYWRIGYGTLSGWRSAPTSAFFGGTVDNAAVYTTALTATQVAAHYAAGR
jgi:hypothetical protein